MGKNDLKTQSLVTMRKPQKKSNITWLRLFLPLYSLLCFLTSPCSYADTESRALKTTAKTISQIPKIKLYAKNGRDHVLRKTGCPKIALYALQIGFVAVTEQKISTKKLRVLIKAGSLRIKPYLDYRLNTKDIRGVVSFVYSF